MSTQTADETQGEVKIKAPKWLWLPLVAALGGAIAGGGLTRLSAQGIAEQSGQQSAKAAQAAVAAAMPSTAEMRQVAREEAQLVADRQALVMQKWLDERLGRVDDRMQVLQRQIADQGQAINAIELMVRAQLSATKGKR
jgi:hypothetical protein